jgi:ABC-type polysaccharide/polyol phosphate export permease
MRGGSNFKAPFSFPSHRVHLKRSLIIIHWTIVRSFVLGTSDKEKWYMILIFGLVGLLVVCLFVIGVCVVIMLRKTRHKGK